MPVHNFWTGNKDQYIYVSYISLPKLLFADGTHSVWI